MVRLLVSDNGRGVESGELKKGFGLSAMAENAERLGGDIHCLFEQQEGFELEAVLPL